MALHRAKPQIAFQAWRGERIRGSCEALSKSTKSLASENSQAKRVLDHLGVLPGAGFVSTARLQRPRHSVLSCLPLAPRTPHPNSRGPRTKTQVSLSHLMPSLCPVSILLCPTTDSALILNNCLQSHRTSHCVEIKGRDHRSQKACKCTIH